ncbi:hypothetical protein [Mesorhizobium sp. LjNodule214]|uniref:hypothetical protein n=1 Tax=Mesorhizobium sp. LjNodule214 TaxID=3342252 RepID=UPI003ECCC093
MGAQVHLSALPLQAERPPHSCTPKLIALKNVPSMGFVCRPEQIYRKWRLARESRADVELIRPELRGLIY